jgi:cytochrome c-type biogenesis protein CcmH
MTEAKGVPMAFWIISVALAMLAALWIVRVMLIQRRTAASPVAVAEGDMMVYRDQLAEIGRDLARGVVAAPEAQRLRTEVERRLLEADRAHQQRSAEGWAPQSANLGLALAGGVVALAAFGLYLYLGAPTYPDQPQSSRLRASEAMRANRPSQAEAEAAAAAEINAAKPVLDPEMSDQIARLRTAMVSRPDDLTGQELLAQYEAASGNYAAAAKAQARVVALKGDTVTGADHASLANLLILSAGGLVTLQAEQALTEALRRDPTNGAARYYSGLLFAQIDRPDLAFRLWRTLYEGSAPDDPWMPVLAGQLDLVAEAAGVDYRAPAPQIKGPDQSDVAAAAELNTEDRNAMIAGMVDRLSTRLEAEGGTAAEWAQLISAHGVLGNGDKAAAAWKQAQQQFAAAPEDLATVRAAAEQAGVAP